MAIFKSITLITVACLADYEFIKVILEWVLGPLFPRWLLGDCISGLAFIFNKGFYPE